MVLMLPHGLEAQDYRNYDAVKGQLEDWARQHPQRMELVTVGSSAGGKNIYVVRLAGEGETAPDERPALFVGANIEGYFNSGTEAALHLIETLLQGGDILATKTFYIAPALNPDAHDGRFGTPKYRLSGNATELDRDRDGLSQEDGPNDLNNDGRITWLRIPDPRADMLPDPNEPRTHIKADPLKGQSGQYRLVIEGHDDDGDGVFNEDGPGGMVPAKNFAHAFQFNDPESGPFAGYTPEAKAVLDFLLERRNVAVAVVYGPANHLLAPPQGFGGGTDVGTMRFKIPRSFAEMMGLDPDEEFTIDEIWEVAKDMPMVRQMNVTKEQLVQFLGAGPATKPDAEDLKYINHLAEAYKKRLDEAGLDNKRAAKQSARGGLTPWLYYQYGAMALELDIWGIPKAAQEAKEGEDDVLTQDRLAEMSTEEFLALDEDTIAAFLESIGAPPQMSAAALKQRVQSGQATPKQMADMARRMGAGGGPAAQEEGSSNDLMAFIDAHASDAFVPWTPVTLPDGTAAEVGGIDPFIEIAPPFELLAPALEVHTETVLALAEKMAQVEIVETKAESLGGGVYRLTAVAANRGFFPTHTKMAQRAQSHLPIRFEMTPGEGVELITGLRWLTSERLEGETGSLNGEWLVRVSGRQRQVKVEVFSDNAGYDTETITVGGNGS
jgi:hypothetical protein